MPAKRSKAQREQHLHVMEKSIIEGLGLSELAQKAAEKFGVSERQAWKDIAEIKRRWAAAGEEIKARNEAMASLAMALRRREQLFRTAYQNGDLKVALETEIDRCRLLALYPGKDGALAAGSGVPAVAAAAQVDLNVTVRHEHDIVVRKCQEFASEFDVLAARQTALPGSSNGNGLHESLDSQDTSPDV